MAAVKRAVIITTTERCLNLFINLISTAILSRLLTQEEFGVSAVGISVMLLAMAVREFASISFLLKRVNMTREDARSAFTVLFSLSFLIAIFLWLLAEPLERFYKVNDTAQFLRVVCFAIVADTACMGLRILLWREMAFGHVAAANLMAGTLGGCVFDWLCICWSRSHEPGVELANYVSCDPRDTLLVEAFTLAFLPFVPELAGIH